MNQTSQSSPVDQIFAVFQSHGDRHYGENVSELQHALQTAEFAKQFGETEDVILCCLLHDYGHMLHNLGEDIALKGVDAKHEEIGAELLKDLFPQAILEPIRQHVAAKRYLCWKIPAYADGLSDSSRLSLQLQGGPMTTKKLRRLKPILTMKPASKFAATMTWAKCPTCRPPIWKAIVR